MPETDCVHHWLIATPNGPTSDAVCIKCKATDVMQNSYEGALWAESWPTGGGLGFYRDAKFVHHPSPSLAEESGAL